MIWGSRLVTGGRNVHNDRPVDGAQQLGRQSSFWRVIFGGCADEDGRNGNLCAARPGKGLDLCAEPVAWSLGDRLSKSRPVVDDLGTGRRRGRILAGVL